MLLTAISIGSSHSSKMAADVRQDGVCCFLLLCIRKKLSAAASIDIGS